METKVTLFELLISCGGVIIAIVGGWIHMRINVASLKTKMEYIQKELESEKSANKDNYDKLTIKIDKIFSLMSEIKVSIASKE